MLAFRNACFLLASGWGLPAFDFGGILVHGLIFGILIVGSQMHVNETVPHAWTLAYEEGAQADPLAVPHPDAAVTPWVAEALERVFGLRDVRR